MIPGDQPRDSRPTGTGSSRGKALLLVLGSAVLVAAGAVWYLWLRPASGTGAPAADRPADAGPAEPVQRRWSSYVCLDCAAQLEVTRTTRRAGAEPEVAEQLRPTPLSERLGGTGFVDRCVHDWYLLGEHDRAPGSSGGERAPNRSGYDLFAGTDAGARALVEFAEATGREPQPTWRTLALWLTHENPRVEDHLAALGRDPAGLGEALRAWLDEHYDEVERRQQGRGRGKTDRLNDSYRSKRYD
jgi:hypothetical protein